MTLDEIKTTGGKYLPWMFFALTMVLATATMAKVAQYHIRLADTPKRIETAAKQNIQDDETVKKLLAKGNELAEALKKKNMFAPPAPKPKQPSCSGIFGDMAIFGDKCYKVGENAGGAKILEVGANFVKIEWEGKPVDLWPFSPGSKTVESPDSKRTEARDERKDKREGPVMARPPEGRMRFGPSSEQRDRRMQRRQRYENASPEERARMHEESGQRRGSRDGDGQGRRGR